jgi:hypothetical protein
MPKESAPADQSPFIVSHTPVVLVIVSLILIVLFGSLWWTKVYNSPRRVFEGMLQNNLSTPSVTRTSQASDQQGLERIEQLSFVPPIASRTYIKLTQDSEQGQAAVQTETIGTQDSDYSKYLKIDVAGGRSNFKSVEGVWGKTTLADGQPQYLSQSMQGLIPFANLSSGDRAKILQLIDQKQIYKVNYASTKPTHLNGKSALNFSVSVNPVNYVSMMKELAKLSGVSGLDGINASDYKDQPSIDINVIVDKQSRQVLEITYGQQKETYSAYGLNQPLATPDKTIPFSELQQKIQAAQ